jgi:hypothetical protein
MPSFTKPSAVFLTLVLATGQRALAANDWSVPCIQGKCSWDVPTDSGTSGSVQIVSLCSTYTKNVAFPYPSLTSYTYAYIVGLYQRDFGHYPCRWLANYDEMQSD